MAWELQIHHYDVETTGDATLIIAREVPPLAVPGAPRIRSALIDGGRKERWAALHAYIGAQIGPGNTLSVLIVTHYCIDHLNGVTQLLLQPNRYNGTFIYDQGWPQVGSNDYTKYVRAINGRDTYKQVLGNAHWAGRTRVTRAVLADNIASTLDYTTDIGLPATPVNPNTNIDEPADWLLTGVGAPAEILWNGAGGPPVGAPQMRFIAANRYVRLAGGGDVLTAHTLGLDPRNEKSLAVEVTFGNFRYYIAGDIETGQENSIQALLNAANNAAGRVPAVKISHHGSSTSTSRAFIDRLRPEAAFISCGTANAHEHPDPEVINVLDGFPAAGPTAGPPPNRPVSHFLTGYQEPFPIVAGGGAPPQSLQGTAGFTAGDPNLLNPQPGHIVVTVDAAQAARPRTGGLYLGVQAAANAAATHPALPGVLAAATALGAATAAAEAALSFDAASAASAFLNRDRKSVV